MEAWTIYAVVAGVVIALAALLAPAAFIGAYAWRVTADQATRERELWEKVTAQLKQERRERARLELIVDRLLRQLREAGLVPSVDDLYVTDRELTHHQIDAHFNESELRSLAFTLGVEYENLIGETKQDKARELVTYMERRDRMGELMALLVERRPGVAW